MRTHHARRLPSLLALAIAGWAIAPAAHSAAAETFFQVDLSRHVTGSLYDPLLKWPGNDLAEVGAGTADQAIAVKTLKGVPFRLDGIVLVGPGQTETAYSGGPVKVATKVEGIPVGRKADFLHFLHATCYWANSGARVGAYVVRYADGSRLEIPLRYGEDILDWWYEESTATPASSAQVAWTGQNEAVSRFGAAGNGNWRIRLFLKTWKNPHPDREIKSLDMVTGEQTAGFQAPTPFLVAVTGAVRPAAVEKERE